MLRWGEAGGAGCAQVPSLGWNTLTMNALRRLGQPIKYSQHVVHSYIAMEALCHVINGLSLLR